MTARRVGGARLDRRRVLAGGGAAALSTLLAACDEEDEPAASPKVARPGTAGSARKRAEVIVVGAGIAGLAAAKDLQKRDVSTIVVEGRDRVGGRVWTDRSLGSPFDLGASWIHGARKNPIADLAKELGLETIKTDFSEVHLWDHDGTRVKDSTVTAIGREWAALQEEIEEGVGGRSGDVSMQKAVELALEGKKLDQAEQRQLSWITAVLEVAAAEDFSRLSTAYSGDDDELGGGDRLFPEGYDAIAKALAKGLDVRRKAKVRRIEHGGQGVRVATSRGVFEGKVALVTVPLGVLRRGVIEFAPALPSKKVAAAARLGMGVLNKVVLQFPETFWPKDRDFLGYMSESHGEFAVFLNARKLSDEHALMALTGGDFARSIEKLSDDQAVARALGVLRRMFGDSVPAPRGRLVARWASDPFAYGSYSHVRVGATSDDFDILAEPVGDRLFFAGEATHRRFRGTVHGALMSGRREAKRIASL